MNQPNPFPPIPVTISGACALESSRSQDVMKRKAEGENVRARTGVRNQAFFSPPTPRFVHAGERDWGKLELSGIYRLSKNSLA